MPVRTSKEVVEIYNYELWNKQNYDLGAEIIADTVIRHYPGKKETLTREESLQRIRDVWANMYSTVQFRLPLLVSDGEYVTMCWEQQAKSYEGEDVNYSSIEVFRVVDGQITEFWNPSYLDASNGFWG